MNLDIVKRYYHHYGGYGSHGSYGGSGSGGTASFFADYWWIFVIIGGALVVGTLLVYLLSNKYLNVYIDNGHFRWHSKAKDEIVPGWRGFMFRKRTPVMGPSSFYPSPPRDAFSTQYPMNGYVPQSSRGPGAYQAPQAYETLQVYPNQGYQTATQANALPPKYEVTHDNGTAGTVSSSSDETYERPSGPPPAHIR